MSDLFLPLADVIQKAAQSKPDGKVAKLKQRYENCSNEVFCLLDCSGSMRDTMGNLSHSKYEHLLWALKDVVKGVPKLRIVAFGAKVVEIKRPEDLPNELRSWNYGGGDGPTGGTPLHTALKYVRQFKPRKTVVISDGLPDSDKAALDAADRITGAIDTIYCGPDNDPAAQFLASLARDTGGSDYHTVVINEQVMVAGSGPGFRPIGETIRGLLAAPE